MSHPARAPRSGIDGKVNAASGQCGEGCVGVDVVEAAGMSHPARAPRSGIDGKANGAGGRCGEGCLGMDAFEAASGRNEKARFSGRATGAGA